MAAPDSEDLSAANVQWYDANPELEDGRVGARRIEFHVTLRTILARLPDRPGLKILDIGGGTGPYSFALAERGHSVTLVDSSSGILALAQARAASDPDALAPARILQGDAARAHRTTPTSQTSTAPSTPSYAVLLLRPLSYITDAHLRAAALHDAWDFPRPRRGVLFCGWVSRYARYRRLAVTEPAGLARRRELYAQHAMDGKYVEVGQDGEVLRAMHDELPVDMPGILRAATGVEDVEMVGTEGTLAGGLGRLVNELEGEEFEAWVQKCFEVGADEHGWQMADHIVGIGIKL